MGAADELPDEAAGAAVGLGEAAGLHAAIALTVATAPSPARNDRRPTRRERRDWNDTLSSSSVQPIQIKLARGTLVCIQSPRYTASRILGHAPARVKRQSRSPPDRRTVGPGLIRGPDIPSAPAGSARMARSRPRSRGSYPRLGVHRCPPRRSVAAARRTRRIRACPAAPASSARPRSCRNRSMRGAAIMSWRPASGSSRRSDRARARSVAPAPPPSRRARPRRRTLRPPPSGDRREGPGSSTA